MPFVDLPKSSAKWRVPRGRTYRPAGPEVNVLGKSKILHLNDEAFDTLGRPARVRVAWDMETRRLGIKKAQPGDKDSYAMTTTKSGSHVISAAALLRTIGMPAQQSGWLPCEMEDDYLAFSPFEGLQSARAPMDDGVTETPDLFEELK